MMYGHHPSMPGMPMPPTDGGGPNDTGAPGPGPGPGAGANAANGGSPSHAAGNGNNNGTENENSSPSKHPNANSMQNMQQQPPPPAGPPHPHQFMPPSHLEMAGYYNDGGLGGGYYPPFHPADAEYHTAMMNGMAMRDMSYYGMMNHELNAGGPGGGGPWHPHMIPPPDAGGGHWGMGNYPPGGGYNMPPQAHNKRPHPQDLESGGEYPHHDMKRARADVGGGEGMMKPPPGGSPINSMHTGGGGEGGNGKKDKPKKGKRAPDMPRRPLSAYNFFFSEERERILAAIPDPDQECSNEAKKNVAATNTVTVASADTCADTCADTSTTSPTDTKDDPTDQKNDNPPAATETTSPPPLRTTAKDPNTKKENDEETQPPPSQEEIEKEKANLAKEIEKRMAARSKRLLELRDTSTSKRRPHRKTHGKIGFKDLVKKIGERWRALPTYDREYYIALAKQDLTRYKEQMTVYNTKHNRVTA
jgi:hypothetical protein